MVKRQLLKKIIRAMWEAKMSYLSCIFVISIGIMCYASLGSTSDNLNYSLESFYDDCRFADVFAQVAGFPSADVAGLASVEGVSESYGRLSDSGRLITDDKSVIVTLRLIGAGGQGSGGLSPGASTHLNMYFAPDGDLDGDFDILIGQEFLDANQLSIGDGVELVLYGQAQTFTVAGQVQSPEYVYTMPDDGSLFPDPKTFGIAFVKSETLELLTGRAGFVSDLAFALEDGYTFENVKSGLEEVLSPYGLTALYERADQPSNLLVSQELNTLGSMSGSMSGLFLLIAGIILYIMLRRLVEHERTQIGTLKAFGYTNAEIVGAYMLNGLITGLVGGMVGAALSIPVSGQYFAVFSDYFAIPQAEMRINATYLINGVALAVGSGLLAAFIGTRNVIKLKPAEAMRPSAPAYITSSLTDRLPLLPALLTKRGMMALRFIGRNKLRSAMIMLSIALSYALMTVGFSYQNLMSKMMLDQFTKVQTYDIKATLKHLTGRDEALSAFRSIEGVKDAEAIIELPVTLEKKNRNRPIAITGLNPGSDKYRIMDDNDRFYTPPADGLIITSNFADTMDIRKGDVINIVNGIYPDGKPILVTDVIGTNFGAGCYMDAEALSAFLRQPAFTNTIVLRTEDGKSPAVKQALTEGRNIASVNDVQRILENYQNLMQSYMMIIYIIMVMGILVAFAVIYNISNISLAERQREFATMRVLGLTPGEASGVLTFENWALFAAAVLIGIPLTVAMRHGLAASLNTELYGMPVQTPTTSYIYSAASCAVAVLMANYVARRKIRRFQLVDVLKERE